ncbi:MAG: metallophosphoesterase [Pseudomonadota bacterium]
MFTRRTFMKLVGGGFVSACALGSYAFAIEPLARLTTTYYRPDVKGWKGAPNLRIAALADIHACRPWMSPERIRYIVEQTNALKPDLIVLLGDYSTGLNLVTEQVHSSEWAPVLSELKAPLGVFAILGNHDWWEDKTAQKFRRGPTFGQRALEKAGIPVLENNAVKLEKDGKPFWLTGLGDQLAFPPFRKYGHKRWKTRDNLAATLDEVSGDDAPAILLAHEPDIFSRVPERFSVTISGHTHGGQVRVFGYSPINTSGQKYNYGHVIEGDKHLFVSGGLGCSVLPVRFGSPPEIVLLELRQKNNIGV